MAASVKRVLLSVSGWGFLLFGIAGLFQPVMPGVLFILIGLFILSSEYVWARHFLRRLRERFPRVSRKADEARVRLTAWLRRFSHPHQ